MDLASIDTRELAETGAVMTVENPSTSAPLTDEAGNSVTITLLGGDSAKLKKRRHEMVNANLKKGFRPRSMTAEKQEADNLTTLALATVSWSGIKVEGETLECNEENARSLYKRFPWLAEQVDAFVGDRGNFSKGA